jgi:subtilisin family serine protease
MKSFSKLAVVLTLSGLVTAAAVAVDIGIDDIPDAATLIASLGAQGATSKKSGVYIVRMAEDPVVAYNGGIRGLPATKPKKNEKINPQSQGVIRYADYLISRHDAALAKVGGGKKLYSYKYSFNGFAAELSKGQLSALRKQSGVISVTPDEMRTLDTISTPDMLDLQAGIWGELGGTGNAGEDVIVGIIDSGIWPENPSFSDRIGKKLVYRQIPGWHGKCTPGESFPASDCNQKMISAQWFNQGFGGDDEIKKLFPNEYVSARDADGHGSHTASTAAGNNDVAAVINGQQVGTASGMAPRARIAAYKVCWGGGCFSTDSVAAIDQAVADGVDVLNFSISGSITSSVGPVEVAFLFAADAGVFVAAPCTTTALG